MSRPQTPEHLAALEQLPTFEAFDGEPKPRFDDDIPRVGLSTYLDASRRGPEPVPDWLITSDEATQEELGLLKTGKEADVHVIERRHGEAVNHLAAKRYRDPAQRQFGNDARYREARRTGDRRIDTAVAKGTRFGRQARAVMWANTEFETLDVLWQAGARVPYPVQLLETEVVMELVGDVGGAAPRLVHAKPTPSHRAELCDQAVELLRTMTGLGLVHGDLSPFNLLVWGNELWMIDLPQVVDLVKNVNGLDFLHRDVTNTVGWFAHKGVDIDPEAVFADLLAEGLGVVS